MAKKKIINTEPIEITPEDSVVPVWLVPLTPEEEAERAQWGIDQAEREAEREAAEAAQAEARIAGLTKLAALGLTEEEVKAVFNL